MGAGLDLCCGTWVGFLYMVSGSSVGCNVPVGAPAAAGSEGHGFCGGRLRCQCPAPVGHHYAAVEPLLDLHLSASVAGS